MRSNVVPLVVVGVIAAVLVAGFSGGAAGGPIIDPAQTVSESLTLPSGQVLDPPPPDYVPAISADKAVLIAASLEDMSSSTSVLPQLALFTEPGSQPVEGPDDTPVGPLVWLKVPAWVITIEGLCIEPQGGGFGQPRSSKCNTEDIVVISADSGQFMESISFQ